MPWDKLIMKCLLNLTWIYDQEGALYGGWGGPCIGSSLVAKGLEFQALACVARVQSLMGELRSHKHGGLHPPTPTKRALWKGKIPCYSCHNVSMNKWIMHEWINRKCCPPSSHQPLKPPSPPAPVLRGTLRGIQDGKIQETFYSLGTGLDRYNKLHI